jgi:tetratricopeptide (TPR) repeat protein
MKLNFFSLLFFLSIIPITLLQGQTKDTLANYYYKQGEAALTKNDYDSAEDLFKKSLDEQESAPAEYGLARVYRADTSHYWWNVSRQRIKKAIELNPDNPEYHLFYGVLAEDLFHYSRLEFDTIEDAIRENNGRSIPRIQQFHPG